ncbi:MAG: cytochrome c oxidase assembly protein [Acidobacteria bacterium]|nr:cytochrome c oxidase assembly protein [Acidobacteriota bacterium]
MSPVSRARPWRLLGLLLLTAPALLAHEGEPLRPHDLWAAWEWDPGVVIPLALSAWLYWRGASHRHGIRTWEAACFWAGWGTLFLALCSPLHPLGEVLFSAHMVQHERLMVVVAPLLVLGRPIVPFVWALPPAWRRSTGAWFKTGWVRASWRKLSSPGAAFLVQGAALWLWHAPPLYEATLENEWVHSLQHISFLGTSLLFWWSILRSHEGRSNYGAGVLYLFLTTLHMGVLAALFTFSPGLFYPAYATTTLPWGLTPMQDQVLAGLIMWVPPGTVYMVAALFMFAAWLRQGEKSALGFRKAWAEDLK